jgi:hypothetical protein
MIATAQLSKPAELRAKTDQDLVRIIDNAVEVGLLLVAADTHDDSAIQLQGRAEETYANALMLLAKIEDENERRRLEAGSISFGKVWTGGWHRWRAFESLLDPLLVTKWHRLLRRGQSRNNCIKAR